MPHIVYKVRVVRERRPSWSSSIPRSSFLFHSSLTFGASSCVVLFTISTVYHLRVTCLMPSGRVFNISPRVTFVVLGDDILCFYVHTGRVRIIIFTRR